MALVGPLLVLLVLIVMIKACFANAYPKGQYSHPIQRRQAEGAESQTVVVLPGQETKEAI